LISMDSSPHAPTPLTVVRWLVYGFAEPRDHDDKVTQSIG